MQRPLVGFDSHLKGEPEDCRPGDAGEDAAVGRGCSQGPFDQDEEVRPARLEQLGAVADQLPKAAVWILDSPPVDPLVGAQPVAQGIQAQPRAALREDGLRHDPTCK